MDEGRLTLRLPRVYLPLLEPARYKGAYGGRGSAKSHTFAELLIATCLSQPGTRAVCVREFQKSLQQSVHRLIADKIRDFGLGEQTFRITDKYILTPGGGRIIFQGLQDHTADSIKSLEGFDIAWVEEAQSLSKRSLGLLRPTIRKLGSSLWFSWNPRSPDDAIEQLLRNPATRVNAPDAVVVQANYTDNPWLPEELRKEIEWDKRDPDIFEHVWLGGYETRSTARVFRNWVEADVPEAPHGTAYYYGADWGYSVDPTVLVRCWTSERTLYVDAEAYRIGCEVDHIPMLFDTADAGQARQWPIVADSSEPGTISYLQRHGYPKVRPAKKGAGSVEEGIRFLQGYDIVVSPKCKHVIQELRAYRYKTHPGTGDPMPVLEDKNNHTIDALRYAVEGLRTPPGLMFATATAAYYG